MPTPRKELSAHKLQNTKPKYIEESSVVAPGRPRFPKNLSTDAKRFFKNLCRMLEQRRTLTEGDQELLRLAAILRDRHERSMEHVIAEGEICTYVRLDSNGAPHDMVKENLWLRCAKDAEKQMVAILDRLGLTPLNRG
ncbi:MAG: P27 family phage terminase small subunit, partial [Thaumarchaeota archaeon]|nr:P27 family phage terminase small subunit [Nitrososphaerota archaeon]